MAFNCGWFFWSANRRKKLNTQLIDKNTCHDCTSKDLEINTLKARIKVLESTVTNLERQYQVLSQEAERAMDSNVIQALSVRPVLMAKKSLVKNGGLPQTRQGIAPPLDSTHSYQNGSYTNHGVTPQ